MQHVLNIRSILNQTKLYNFHSHTQFCDGRDVMENFVKSAISLGYKHYGFSPHAPIAVESSCNMSEEDVPVYLAEVKRLQSLYGDKINLYASMEIDYLNDECSPATEYYQQLPLDYRVGSVHFVPTQSGEYIDCDGRFERFKTKMQMCFDNDIEYVVRTFYAQSQRMIEAGGFDIIGHFDKIGLNASLYHPGIEDEPWYAQLVSETLDAILDHNLLVEVNTKSVQQYGRTFPHERYYRWLSERNAIVVVNSDAHYPDLIDASREQVIKKLRAYRVNV